MTVSLLTVLTKMMNVSLLTVLTMSCQLAELEKDLDDGEKTSQSVAQSIAGIINKRFDKGLSDEKLKQRLDKYTRPKNCQNLQVPTINPKVWKKYVPPTMKQHDLKLAMVQRTIVKATAALVQSTQMILKAYKKGTFTDKTCKDQIYAQNGDAMALLGHMCCEVSMRRQFSIHPYLPKHLKGLCSDSVPVTNQLFGDNIAASVKEAKELDKLINTPGTSGYHPHYDNRRRNSRHGFYKQHPNVLGQKNSNKQPFTLKKHFGNKGIKQSHPRRA